MSDEVAQEVQVISNGNTNIDGPQANLQNEISDPDEYAKAANVTVMREAEKTDFSLKTKDEEVSRVANPTPPDPGSPLPADLLVTLPDRSCMGDPTYELDLCLRPRLDLEAESLCAVDAYGSSSSADSFMPVTGHRVQCR